MMHSDRTQRLDDDLRALGAPGDTARRDQLLAAAGVLLMIAGVVVAMVGYGISATTSDPLRQSDGRALGPIAITVALLGVALFLRFSATRFLRFWLARLVAERRPSELTPTELTPTELTSAPARPTHERTTPERGD